jgi:hypothetical protein
MESVQRSSKRLEREGGARGTEKKNKRAAFPNVLTVY